MNHLTQAWGAFTKQADRIARGMLVLNIERNLGLKIVKGTVTAADFFTSGAIEEPVGIWWGVLDRDMGIADFEVYALGNGGFEETLRKYYEDGTALESDIWGEVMVVLVGERPAGWEPQDRDGYYVDDGQPIKLNELRYDAGWGWKTLPCSMTVTATSGGEPFPLAP